jgi:hypothetical protein
LVWMVWWKNKIFPSSENSQWLINRGVVTPNILRIYGWSLFKTRKSPPSLWLEKESSLPSRPYPRCRRGLQPNYNN